MKGLAIYNSDFVTIKEDIELIKENITRILLTLPSERVMSNFGCKLRAFLFEQSTVLQEEVESEIKKSISRWEPRVQINSLFITAVEANKAEIFLSLTYKETLEQFTYEKILRF